VTLYALDATHPSAPAMVREVAQGLERVIADDERRRLIVASPPNAPVDFSIIDMDAPSKGRVLHFGYKPTAFLPGDRIYLLDLPGKGEAIALGLTKIPDTLFIPPEGAAAWIPPTKFSALYLDPLQSQATELPLEDARFLRTAGIGGVGSSVGRGHVQSLRGNPLAIIGTGRTPLAFDLPARPPSLIRAAAADVFTLVVNNDAATVMTGAYGVTGIFDKQSKSWSRAPGSFWGSRIRAFGPWLAVIEEAPARIPAGLTTLHVGDKYNGVQLGESPGKEKRQSEHLDSKSTVDDLFDGMSSFPGKLTLYNVHSGATLEIATKQGDSEVLLITDSAVFYRVNDALYRAPFSVAGLGRAVKLAEGDEIVQAHWAFLSPN
jgi:hypothetical protein